MSAASGSAADGTQADAALDAAVAAACGWAERTPETTGEESLRRLLALNRERV